MNNNNVKRARIMMSDNSSREVNNNSSSCSSSNFVDSHNNNMLATAGISLNSVLGDNNIYLSICDDDEDENSSAACDNNNATTEYVAIDRCPLLQQQQQQLKRSSTTNVQYCLTNVNAASAVSSATCAATVLPAAVQLPSACEIYLIKELVQPFNNHLTTNAVNANVTTIKVEPAIAAAAAADDAKVVAANNTLQFVANTNNACFNVSKLPVKTNQQQRTVDVAKRSYILEAYKKRDDRRRATHNEVERRRRDKINSWIFKLKEMLPTDMSGVCYQNAEQPPKKAHANNNPCQQHPQQTTMPQNRHNAQNDSKSQILIKACEYIKTMQQEINSLRECLTENEQLRANNQRLQQELNKLKRERINGTGNFNLTLNSLNNMCVDSAADSDTIIVAASTSVEEIPENSLTCFTKRQLIIRDYVD